MGVRVLIADDHRLFAEALEAILSGDDRIDVHGQDAVECVHPVADRTGPDDRVTSDEEQVAAEQDATGRHLHDHVDRLLRSQGVRIIEGTARLKGPHEIVAETATGLEEMEADAIVIAGIHSGRRGSR